MEPIERIPEGTEPAGTRVHAAYHEAGHAVVALHFGLEVYSIELINLAGSQRRGKVEYEDPLAGIDVNRAGEAAVRKRIEIEIMVGWAGPCADENCDADGFDRTYVSHDEELIARVLEQVCNARCQDNLLERLPKLKAAAAYLVNKEWARIATLAEALLRQGRLDGDGIHRALGECR